MEESKQKLHKSRTELALITKQQEQVKEKLADLKSDSEGYAENETLQKKLKGKEVDLVHVISETKQHVDQLAEKMQEFWKANINDFKDVFTKRSGMLKADLLDTLNLLAYRFDRQLWHRAKQSDSIRNFFVESRIQGLFSSKTFLEYYTGHVDVKTAGPMLKELIRYLNNYNRTNKIPIAVLGQDSAEVNTMRQIVEAVDPVVKGIGFLDGNALMRQHEKDPFEVIIIEYYLGRETAIDFLKTFRTKFAKMLDEVILVVNLPAQNARSEYQNTLDNGIKYTLYRGMNRDSIIQKMMEIL